MLLLAATIADDRKRGRRQLSFPWPLLEQILLHLDTLDENDALREELSCFMTIRKDVEFSHGASEESPPATYLGTFSQQLRSFRQT
jgi:hypothetical protein